MEGLYIFCLLLACVASDCPRGFTQHNDYCYSLVKVRASWAEAVVYCQAVGATLARVDTETEHQFLKTWMTQESSTIVTGGVWIGGLDYEVEGEWQWAFAGDRISKTYWSPTSPDNIGSSGQDCIILWKGEQFQWNDDQCSDTNYFLCQTEAPTSPGNGD